MRVLKAKSQSLPLLESLAQLMKRRKYLLKVVNLKLQLQMPIKEVPPQRGTGSAVTVTVTVTVIVIGVRTRIPDVIVTPFGTTRSHSTATILASGHEFLMLVQVCYIPLHKCTSRPHHATRNIDSFICCGNTIVMIYLFAGYMNPYMAPPHMPMMPIFNQIYPT